MSDVCTAKQFLKKTVPRNKTAKIIFVEFAAQSTLTYEQKIISQLYNINVNNF